MFFMRKPYVVRAMYVDVIIDTAAISVKALPDWIREPHENNALLINAHGVTVHTREGPVSGARGSILVSQMNGEMTIRSATQFNEEYESIKNDS